MCDNPRSGLHVRTVEVQRGGTGRLGEDQGIKFSQVLPSQGQEGELEKKRAGMMGYGGQRAPGWRNGGFQTWRHSRDKSSVRS